MEPYVDAVVDVTVVRVLLFVVQALCLAQLTCYG